MSTQLAENFANSKLPKDLDLDDIIRADPAYLFWVTGDDDYVTKEGAEIVTFHDRFDSEKSFAVTGAARRAAIVENGLLRSDVTPTPTEGDQAARFDSDQTTDWDQYNSAGFTLPSSGPFTFWCIFKLETIGVNQAIMGRYASTTSRALLQVTNTNKLRMLAKSYYAESATALAINTWYLAMGSYDGANTVRLWHKSLVTSGDAPTGDIDTGVINIGTLDDAAFQSADMLLSDAGCFVAERLAALSDEEATNDTIEAIILLASQRYGIIVS